MTFLDRTDFDNTLFSPQINKSCIFVPTTIDFIIRFRTKNMNKFYLLCCWCLLVSPCMAQNLNQGFEDPDITNGGCFSVLGNAFSNTSDEDDRILYGARSMGMSYTAIPPTPAYYISPVLPMGSHTLYFYIKPSNCGTSGAIEMGTVTNPTGTGFALVCSESVDCNGPTAWGLVSCAITTNVANPHVAIRLNGPGQTYYFDSLSITDIGGALPPFCGSLLPVDLFQLRAQIQKEAVLLTWTTASERNNKGFAIERRTANNSGWTTLGFVPGLGNTPMGRDYEFVDDQPARGVNYYRIQQFDFDGSVKNFPIVSVTKGESLRVQLSPNPVHGQLNVTLDGETESESNVLVMDAMGRVVLERSFLGKYAELNLSTLPPGAYFVRVQSGGDVMQERVLLR